jgi:hypothetical protein
MDIFKPIYPNHFLVFVKLFSLLLLVIILYNFKDQLRYLKTNPVKIYGNHQKLLNQYPIPSPNPTFYIIFGAIFLISLLAIFLGIHPSIFSFICLVLYFPIFNSIQSLDYIQRKTNLLPFIFLIFIFSSGIHIKYNSPNGVWEIILIKILIAQVYFSAGINKLKKGGIAWITGANLQAYFLENYLWNNGKIIYDVAQRKNLCSVISIVVLFFELSFIIIVFIPKLTFLYVLFGFFFHCSTIVLMRINYLKYLSPVYLIFFCDLTIWSKLNLI